MPPDAIGDVVLLERGRAVQDLRSVVRARLERLKTRITEEMRAAETQERDRAHQATCGDRPFVGCGPCEPADIEAPAIQGENPAAKPRP